MLKKLDRYDEFKEQDYVAAMEEVSLSPEAFAAVKVGQRSLTLDLIRSCAVADMVCGVLPCSVTF